MISDGFYNCSKCGRYNPNQGICRFHQCQVNANQCCKNYSQETDICDNCHKIIYGTPLIWTGKDGQYKILCSQCFKLL